MYTPLKSQIIALARATPDQEVCGFIYHDQLRHPGEPLLWPCANVAGDPAHAFEISEADHMAVLARGEILAVYHSHPHSPGFSQGCDDCDIERAQRLAVPFYLYTVAVDTWQEYIPPTYTPHLTGRAFVAGMDDCYELVRLYCRQHYGHYMGDYDRGDLTTDLQTLIMARFAAEGFEQVALTAAKVGDVLMFRSDRALAAHFGVLVGPSKMLHHQIGQLAREDMVTDRWLNRVVAVFRWRGADLTAKMTTIPV